MTGRHVTDEQITETVRLGPWLDNQEPQRPNEAA
jgi:hypothetical protein